MYVDRKYRHRLSTDLETFEVKIKETDLLVSVKPGCFDDQVKEKIYRYTFLLRSELEAYIRTDPDFFHTLSPYIVRSDAPLIAREMARRANSAGVGPMAAVAGGFAELVGRFTRRFSDEVIVENGGDIFLDCRKQKVIGVFAGESLFSNRIGIRISSGQMPLGICTSSGIVGPSLSFGRADAAIILAQSAFLADAVATAVGNRIQTPEDFDTALNFANKIVGVSGVLLIKDDKMAVWGAVELVPLKKTIDCKKQK